MTCAGDGGFDPQVGEIRAVRTFRVGPGGVLFPLFSRRPWVDGANEAACTAAHVVADPSDHVPPDPDCTCGFYAYADPSAAGEYPYARHVLAVVMCWGRVIVGTKGLRAQRARIEAVWLSKIVPADLVRMVADRYPTARMYSDRGATLTAHAPTVAAQLEADQVAGPHRRRSTARILVVAAIAAGLLPTAWIARLPYGWAAWSAILCVLLCVSLVPRHRRPDAVVQRQRLVCLALAVWMLSLLAGTAGLFLLRLPLLQIAVLASAQRAAMNREARVFPAHIV